MKIQSIPARSMPAYTKFTVSSKRWFIEMCSFSFIIFYYGRKCCYDNVGTATGGNISIMQLSKKTDMLSWFYKH